MIREIADRLRVEVTALESVATTAELTAAVAGRLRHRLPAAFVHPVRDRADPNTVVGATSQRLVRIVGVLLLLPSTAADRGAGLPDAVEDLSARVRTALVGWQPPDHEPLELDGGELVRIADGVAWWLETYRTSILVRA